ncbi:MTP-1 family protein [Paenibacillus sp. sgz302251]|uniref:MTP-1 family protein n=1 Tax=Paenibacillus sp. sgz302251 TaxID=3414493 RepID=UPI003C7E4B39
MGKLIKNEVKTCATLLEQYLEKNKPVINPVKLLFKGVGDRDVYNISAPFEDDGEQVIAGRVESRDSEHSHIMFFVERNGEWIPREGMQELELQDPFYTRVGGEIVLGGVQVYPHPTNAGALAWRTVMYKGKRLRELELFFTGPNGMKDLRIAELHDGSIVILTRPQGEKGGRGKIGFMRLASLAELTIEKVEEAPLLNEQFIDAEWGGANEIHLLSNGLVGVLGHIASFDEAGDRHYYPMVFALNPFTGEYTDIEIIAIRDKFLPGESKRTDLVDVVFSGGLVRKKDGFADLYAGISDAEAHRMTIQDPFLKFERLEVSL